MSDRDRVLGRIRGALADVPGDERAAWALTDDPDPAVAYRRARGAEARNELVDRFIERCGDYSARVRRCAAPDAAVAGAVAEACARHGVRALVVAPGLHEGWRPPGVAVHGDDPPLAVAALDGCDGVLTGCAVAIADTGTIVLDAGPGQGRRALTLVPDLHICVVAAEQIVAGVPEAIAVLACAVGARRPLTFISGPSATSDIELTRVEGVHGPRRLEVIVTGPDAGAPDAGPRERP